MWKVLFFTLLLGGLLLRTLMMWRKGKVTLSYALFWFMVWALGIILIFIPDISSIVATKIGIGRGVDLIIYVSIIILFYFQFRTLNKLYQLEKDVSQLISTIACEHSIRIIKDK